MMMAMLEAGGVNCVYEQYADEHNPGGYFEHPEALYGIFDHVPGDAAVKIMHMLPTLDIPDCQVIVMRRDLAQVAASMLRWRDRVPDATFLRNQLDSTRLWCASRPHLEVWYADVLRYPAHECLRVARFLGRDLDLAGMAAVVCQP